MVNSPVAAAANDHSLTVILQENIVHPKLSDVILQENIVHPKLSYVILQ